MEKLNFETNNNYCFEDINKLQNNEIIELKYGYSTLYIGGGKKDKLRTGDILGALIQAVGLTKEDIGKISILPKCSYVAIKNGSYEKAYKGLLSNKMKNRIFKVFKR